MPDYNVTVTSHGQKGRITAGAVIIDSGAARPSNRAPIFAMTGVGGFVAPRHLQAIQAVGGNLVAALDPHDAVGILDKYSRNTDFFTEPERFERHLEQLRRHGDSGIDWLAVCSPNFLHDNHARMGMHVGANVLCEKPLTLTPWNLDALAETERETGRRVYTVLQLRHVLPKLPEKHTYERVALRYVTPRGRWYQQSWKNDVEKSGGLITNIGIHMLDLLLQLFGPITTARVRVRSTKRAIGSFDFQSGLSVAWLLSIDADDAPDGSAQRMLTFSRGEKEATTIDLGERFEGLHTTVYRKTLAGEGHSIEDARPAVELAYRLRHITPGTPIQIRPPG